MLRQNKTYMRSIFHIANDNKLGVGSEIFISQGTYGTIFQAPL